MIEWFARNPVAANILMFAVIIAGLISATTSVPVETFPSLERDVINIRTDFRGATPKTVEDGITLRIEEAIADIEGIKEIISRSTEGGATVRAEIASGYDKRNLLDDIKVRVDALNTLPVEAEKPVISISTYNPTVIYIAISGQVDSKTLRQTATRFREGLLAKKGVSNVRIQGVAKYEIAVEVDPSTLHNYNLSLADIGQAIRLGSADISAGNIQTRDGDILIRSDGQAYSAAEFANIPIIADPTGQPIKLGDVAKVIDGFEDLQLRTSFNGEPSVMIEVRRVGEESAIQVAATARDYMQEFSASLATDMSIAFWDDDSAYLKTRISAVINSAIFGGILVMLLLSLFLRPIVAFWVFLGIPVSFMGAVLFMPLVGGSFNVATLFAFIMVLGIVVDDAIVTGESIYRKIRTGMEPLQASILGTKEIAVPVTFGILTTVVAFLPLNFLGTNRLAYVASQMPMVVIPVMLMSLVESKLVLPAHLSHIKKRGDDIQLSGLGRVQQRISRSLELFVEHRYQPFLQRCLRNKTITVSILLAVSCLVLSWAYFGHIKFSPFPAVESDTVSINLVMPETTGFATTDQHIQSIVEHFKHLQEQYRDPITGQSIVTNILATSGSAGRTTKPNLGSVRAEILPMEKRHIDIGANHIAREIRQRVGDIPGAQQFSVRADRFRTEAPINIEISGLATAKLGQVALLLREKFREYPAIYDIQDNYSGGKEELSLTLKPRAYALGLNLNQVARQVRHAVFGFQAQRIQRGRDELRVMVRYPLNYRSSIDDLRQLPIRVANGRDEVRLADIADLTPAESPSALYRVNRSSILNVTADIDKELATIPSVVDDLEEYLVSIQHRYPGLKIRFDGEVEDQAETNLRLLIGLGIMLAAIYALLAIPFKSYGQPFIVMSIIPFSLVGAVLGHILTQQNLSSLSIFGILALIGVVVNDSLVLVDTINKRRAEGKQLLDAVMFAGARRFRPVILTSITTFAGVVPLLLDQGSQAKFLKPMVTSLGFGILFATVITLIIVPINYIAAHKFKYAVIDLAKRANAFWNSESMPPLHSGDSHK